MFLTLKRERLEFLLCLLLYLEFCTQRLSKVYVAHICDLCKSLVKSRGAFLYTNLGFLRRRFIYALMINSVAVIEA